MYKLSILYQFCIGQNCMFFKSNLFDILNGFERLKVLLIADEAHNTGSLTNMKRIGDIKYLPRITILIVHSVSEVAVTVPAVHAFQNGT